MLLRQIQNFNAVVRLNSFSEAAYENHISQSAISQQIKALESELGVTLLERHNRTFSLTSAGEIFYRQSMPILQQVEGLKKATIQAAKSDEVTLNVGYVSFYGGNEFQLAVAKFAAQYPKVHINLREGSHEDLYVAVRDGQLDVIMNDQRRAFSDEFVNMELTESKSYLQVAATSTMANLSKIDISTLKDVPCILIAQPDQEENEATYYRDIVGFKGKFVFAKNLQEARLLILAGRGVMPIEGVDPAQHFDAAVKMIPLMRKGKQLERKYCAFWLQDNSGYYIESFAEILEAEFKR